jgi:hypothetical protein
VPSLPVSTLFTSWIAHEMPQRIPNVYGGNLPDDLVWFEDRFIAVGGVNAGCCDGGFSTDTQALVWRSRDGVAWNLVPDSGAFDLGHMHAVAATGSVVVAVGWLSLESDEHRGSTEHVGAAWPSVDGRDWQVVSDLPLFGDVETMDGAFFATVEDFERPAPQIWRSTDGQSWTRVAGGAELGAGVIKRLIRTPNGLLAVGASVNVGAVSGANEDVHAAVWRSTDGLIWSRVADQPAFADGTMVDVAIRDGRYLAVGHDNEHAGGETWVSDDAVKWERADHPAFGPDGIELMTILALDAGFVVTGDGPRPDGGLDFMAWTSVDGRSWSAIPDQPAFDGAEVRTDGWLALPGGAGIAIGMRWVDGAQPTAWLIH